MSGEIRTEYIDEMSADRVRNDTFRALFSLGVPELNSVEQCWNQLIEWFNYLLIEDLSHLQEELQIAVGEVDELNLFNPASRGVRLRPQNKYFCSVL